MSEVRTTSVPMPQDNPERLDRYLVRVGLASSRRAARQMLEQRRVRVNGVTAVKSRMVGPKDCIEVEAASPARDIEPEAETPLEVLFADAAMLIVNKPGGVPCHPLRPGERGTVMNALVARYPETALAGDKPLEGGLVHRLDNGTSGALIVARTRTAFEELRRAIRTGRVRRRYLALVEGRPEAEMFLDAPVAHHPKSARRMVVAADEREAHRLGARRAISRVEPLRSGRRFSLVQVDPATGARHQIRVHLANAGFPILGDTLYGGPSTPDLEPGRFCLHLAEIELESPASGTVRVRAELPQDLKAIIERDKSTA